MLTDIRFIVFLTITSVVFLASLRLEAQEEHPNKRYKRTGIVLMSLAWLCVIITGVL